MTDNHQIATTKHFEINFRLSIRTHIVHGMDGKSRICCPIQHTVNAILWFGFFARELLIENCGQHLNFLNPYIVKLSIWPPSKRMSNLLIINKIKKFYTVCLFTGHSLERLHRPHKSAIIKTKSKHDFFQIHACTIHCHILTYRVLTYTLHCFKLTYSVLYILAASERLCSAAVALCSSCI